VSQGIGQGANVVKFEPPQGDPARTFSKIFGNLRTEGGRTAALGLLCVAG
jgi:hypothetical protein